jgi:hypothetical protein
MDGDNAEGSSRSPKLSVAQRAVLTGTLLGDGCLAQHGRFHRLHVKHKVEHRALAELKYRVFGEFITMPLHQFDQRLGSKLFPCVQFATRTSPLFSSWHSRFYRDRRKIVPEDIVLDLTPHALAVWFMDDGAADHAGVTFQTHSFELGETRLLVSVLRERFDLAAVLRRNRGRWIIYVGAASMPNLREVLEPLVLPQLAYKLRSRTP